MSFLCNNVAAFAVAMVASVLVWLFGGTRGDLLKPVAPWLIVFLVCRLLLGASRRSA